MIDQIRRDKPQQRRRFCTQRRRVLEAEDDQAFEMRVKRSAFSTLLQEEEDRVLMAVVGKLRELGRVVLCLIYDGCLVRREGEGPLGDDVIRACEAAIAHKTGYRLKLWEKCLMCGEKLASCSCG